MGLPDFPIAYRLGSPASRQPRSTIDELRAAFPNETTIRFLGAGAFGETWRVGDRAVKIIVADGLDERRIAREIQAAGMSCPHVVSLEATMTLFAAGEDRSALVFNYVKGDDLASRIATDGGVDEDDLLGLAVGLLTGLDVLRGARIIHRDVKPENVQLRLGNFAKPVLLDLGLAYIGDATSLTVYPAALGTRAYMPPEILRGEHAVHRSDIFSLGVTLFIAASGEHPFLADGEMVMRDDMLLRIEQGCGLDLDDEHFAEVITAMLEPQAFRRPTAEKALRRLSE